MNTAPFLNQARVPVRRANGTLELLPWGYDPDTGVTTLRTVQEGPEPEPGGIKGTKTLGKPSEKVDGELPGLEGFKGFLHALLPLLVLSQIHAEGPRLDENGFPRISRELQHIERPGNEVRIGFHAPHSKPASQTSQAA